MQTSEEYGSKATVQVYIRKILFFVILVLSQCSVFKNGDNLGIKAFLGCRTV